LEVGITLPSIARRNSLMFLLLTLTLATGCELVAPVLRRSGEALACGAEQLSSFVARADQEHCLLVLELDSTWRLGILPRLALLVQPIVHVYWCLDHSCKTTSQVLGHTLVVGQNHPCTDANDRLLLVALRILNCMGVDRSCFLLRCLFRLSFLEHLLTFSK
jgi:hypothetical protein